MHKSLLETFATLDENLKHSLADIKFPRILAFATLEIAVTTCGIDKLSTEHIVACLEAAGVSVKKISVQRSLASAAGYVSSTKENGDIFFRLMTKGKREIEGIFSEGKLSIVRIEKDQPRTARLNLHELFQNINGITRICDPYFGIRTLDLLDHIPKLVNVKFLTSHINESKRQLDGALKDFKREKPNVEFKVVGKDAGLHDRFLVTDKQIMILGHGLKDVGNKESFIIRLDKDLVPNLIQETISAFDLKWAIGTII